MSNSNNPNTGGVGDSAISSLLTKKSSASSPDHQPSEQAFGGKTFLSGSPAGREAKPKPKVDGGDPILT